MTIPYQHNCPHSPDGWCLDCVEKLSEESLSIQLKKLSPQSGDLIQIKTPNLLRTQELAALDKAIRELREKKFKDISFVVVGDDYDFENIPEDKMNELGWYKKH
jgi:hypothetical protein